MKYFLLKIVVVIICTCSFLFSQEIEDTIHIYSGTMQYDGKSIELKEDVCIQHPLGQIQAYHISIESIPEKKLKFACVNMSKDVQFFFSKQGKLTCQKAIINQDTGKGEFFGNEDHPKVECFLPPFFVLTSRQIQIEWINPQLKPDVQTIRAWQDVDIYYKNKYCLQAEDAVYHFSPSPYLTLSSVTEKCNLQEENKWIQAQQIEIDPKEKKFSFLYPQAKIQLSKDSIIELEAEKLIGKEKEGIFHWIGNVSIQQNNCFSLSTPDEIFLAQAQQKDKKNSFTLYSPKNTRISYTLQNEIQTITCPGPFFLDHEKLELKMGEWKDLFLPEQQIVVKASWGQLQADQALIKYDWYDSQFIPQSMVIDGKIKLLLQANQNNVQAPQIILADRVEYQIEKKLLIVSAKPGKRVLLEDKANHLQISASCLQIQQTCSNNSPLIQGVGDVRFTFLEEEKKSIMNSYLQK